ncbi:hypothetical protein HYH03_002624 [Edaphochlamys debaryana]|uniref:Uncharacterized protein n=1 Tax=Edaphochlamys debaryana TaxID=47281 RepID=A0A836C5C1_9CHLO|nr:hypothetical protein HYH03_002624 [Edaphochlamys debaryana]|eukprot:KAG2499689.1 hypothetical protein HYH03_002624 [Edaphochlamys debaryana]
MAPSLLHSSRACSCSSRATRLRVNASASAGGSVPRYPGAGGGSSHGRENASPATTGVFQLDGNPIPTTILDVRDAYEACSVSRSAKERRQCFEVYGLDADKVDRYFVPVTSMERLIDQGDRAAQQMVASGGSVLLYFMAYCILKV